jgi:hypothetical protein
VDAGMARLRRRRRSKEPDFNPAIDFDEGLIIFSGRQKTVRYNLVFCFLRGTESLALRSLRKKVRDMTQMLRDMTRFLLPV